MVIVIASQVDDRAHQLVRDLPAGSARLLTPRDLSRPGWRIPSSDPEAGTCVAGARRLAVRRVTGVLCLLPFVFERELVDIDPRERTYVAAEMTSFLLHWLAALGCRKLNPPAPGCLSGPGLRPEAWLALADAAGLAVEPLRRTTREPAPPAPGGGYETVLVIGERCLGARRPDLDAQALALARAAGVGMLGVTFATSGARPRFAGASTFPDVATPGAAAAIHAYLGGEARA